MIFDRVQTVRQVMGKSWKPDSVRQDLIEAGMLKPYRIDRKRIFLTPTQKARGVVPVFLQEAYWLRRLALNSSESEAEAHNLRASYMDEAAELLTGTHLCPPGVLK